MSLTVELPAETEALARAANPDFGAYAREAVAVQLFRDGTLSHFESGRALGLDRFETDALRKRYRVA